MLRMVKKGKIGIKCYSESRYAKAFNKYMNRDKNSLYLT